MLDIQDISIVIAALSVVIGVIFNTLSLRNSSKSRQASVFLDFHKQVDTKFLVDMTEIVVEWDWIDYQDFFIKYGPRTNPKAYAKYIQIGSLFDSMGKLLETKTTRAEFIPESTAVLAMGWYEKTESIAAEFESRYKSPESKNSTKLLYETLQKLGYRSPVQ
jgi:hypothetical protein